MAHSAPVFPVSTPRSPEFGTEPSIIAGNRFENFRRCFSDMALIMTSECSIDSFVPLGLDVVNKRAQP